MSPEIHTQLLQKPSESGVFVNQVGTDISKAIQIVPKHSGGGSRGGGGGPSKSVL